MQISKQTGYEDTDGALSTLLLKIQSDWTQVILTYNPVVAGSSFL